MSEKQTVDRRQMLKQAAVHLACRNGYDRTTIKDIAKHCDVTVGVIYHYFANKEELFKEALADKIPYYSEVLPATLKLPVEEGLVHIATLLINGARIRSEMMAVIIGESLRNPEILSLFINVVTNARKLMETYFEEKIKSGELAPHNPKIMVNLFFGHFLTSFFHKQMLGIEYLPEIDEEFIQESVKMMLAGWKQGG
ncbi:TetR/AcrR family transcriptional regulator [Brevibacillus ginsengisoli]|uniref:TetR/AcrR family transcriptional regulator n=1 Tax=Brevibacillus ginsengisoli TaxID=363854 RepID=UPI003CED4292